MRHLTSASSRRALPLLLVAGLAACAQSDGPGPISGGGGATDPTTGSGTGTASPGDGAGGTSGAVATRLADRDLRAETRGAWAYRSATRSSGGPGRAGLGRSKGEAAHGGDESKSVERLALSDSDGGWASGGADGGGGPATGAARPLGGPAPAPAAPAISGEGVAISDVRRSRSTDSREPSTDVARPAMPMRAGSTDDNADFGPFLAFLAQRTGNGDLQGRFQAIDVRDRKFVRVVDAKGRPVPGTRVTVLDEAADRLVTEGTTYGDGRVPVYPRLGAKDGALPASILAEVRHASGVVRGRFALSSGDEFTLTVAGNVAPPDPVPLDVTFLIDTTGSMGDEIASIQDCLLRVTQKIRGLARESDLRYATVLYRDVDDQYLTATHPFTADVDALEKALREVRANGGGDGPESLNQGLSEAVNGLAWRDGAAKVVFLIADAPPHMDYTGDVPYGDTCVRAVAKGIRVHTVAASGLDAAGTLVFRQIAQATRGKFVFVEYGVPGSGEDAKGHGVAGAVKNDNLEDVIFDQIRDEVARWGR